MSFFKEFKEDFSQAVNELVPGEGMNQKEDELVVNTLEQEVDAKAELDKLGGLFEKAEEPAAAPRQEALRAQPKSAPAKAQMQEESTKPSENGLYLLTQMIISRRTFFP